MSKFQNLLEKYPSYQQAIRTLAQNDPSGKNKYLEWGIKQIAEGCHYTDDVCTAIKNFHINVPKLKNKDIYKYTLDELVSALDRAKSKREERKEVKSLTETIFEDQDWKVLRIEAPEAATLYGKGTRWCITTPKRFTQYAIKGNPLFYILSKTEKGPKYAMYGSLKMGSRPYLYDSRDIVGRASRKMPENIFTTIKESVKNNPESLFTHRLRTDIDFAWERFLLSKNWGTISLIRSIKNEEMIKKLFQRQWKENGLKTKTTQIFSQLSYKNKDQALKDGFTLKKTYDSVFSYMFPKRLIAKYPSQFSKTILCTKLPFSKFHLIKGKLSSKTQAYLLNRFWDLPRDSLISFIENEKISTGVKIAAATSLSKKLSYAELGEFVLKGILGN
ncbi:MAG: hypothetical protein ACFFG0_39080 [Candidatus Thorarchaeota archaeon]